MTNLEKLSEEKVAPLLLMIRCLDRVAEEKNIHCQVIVGKDYDEVKELKNYLEHTLTDE